jgi:hypothetical protein
MTEPVSEQIMAKVKTRVATALTAHRSALVATWQPKDQVTHIFQGDVIANDAISCPGNPPAKGWTLQAGVAGICKPSDTDTTPIDTFKNRIGSDIVGAITTGATWHNWDGLAIDSEVTQIEDYTGTDGASSGVLVRLSIHFRTDEDDLTVARA